MHFSDVEISKKNYYTDAYVLLAKSEVGWGNIKKNVL